MDLNEERVKKASPDRANTEIEERTNMSIHYYSRFPERIDERIEELDKEWDVERVLLTNAAAFGGAGLALSIFNRKWLFLSGGVLAFLLNHGVQGWCPPLPLFRKFGVRTASEILREKYALRAIRGDFDDICDIKDKEPHEKADRIIGILKSTNNI